MSLSNSRLSYSDCFELLDRAIEEPRGIRLEVVDSNKAGYLRMRIHQARQIDRVENKKIYPDAEHYLHGRSVYDILVCRIEEGPDSVWVWLDKLKVEIGRIESIPEGSQIEHVPILQIEGPKERLVEVFKLEPRPMFRDPQIRRR